MAHHHSSRPEECSGYSFFKSCHNNLLEAFDSRSRNRAWQVLSFDLDVGQTGFGGCMFGMIIAKLDGCTIKYNQVYTLCKVISGK